MRSWNVARNAVIGMTLQGVALLLGFAVRTVFVRTLSEEYLGMTSLFTSMLALLNLSELGLSTAITFALYRPIAEGNRGKIVSLMRFYRNAYRMVGGALLLFGIMLCPFLPVWMKEGAVLVNIYLVYAMYLGQTVFSYWFLAYKSVLLTASQNEYLVSVSTWLSKMAASVLQISCLWILGNNPEIAFYVFVGIGVLSTLTTNYFVAAIVDRRFPYINQQNPKEIESTEKDEIYRNIAGLAIYKVLGVLGTSISNILISVYVSLSSVGLYANYTLLQSGISGVLSSLYKPFVASIGNLNVMESEERKEFIFRCLYLFSFWIGGLCSIVMWVLFGPFIGSIWLDKTWLLSSAEEGLFVLRFLVDICLGPVIWFREAAGLFWKARYRYILSVAINISASFYFVAVRDMGIIGVLLGILVGDCVRIIIDPFIVFREVFHKPCWGFHRIYLCSLALVFATAILVKQICGFWDAYTLRGFFAATIACMVFPNLLWWLMFRHLREYCYLSKTVKTILQKKVLGHLH